MNLRFFAFFPFLLVVAPYDRVMVVNSDYLNERSHERVTTEGYRGYSYRQIMRDTRGLKVN